MNPVSPALPTSCHDLANHLRIVGSLMLPLGPRNRNREGLVVELGRGVLKGCKHVPECTWIVSGGM